MSQDSHPVWAVYDKLRTASLNVKYYSRRLVNLERQNFCIELFLMATAPSSAIAGLWFWQTETGKETWLVLGVVTAVLAVVKPLLGLTKRIRDLEGVLSDYRMLEYDLRELKSLIEQRQKYDAALQADFKRVGQRERSLVERTPESREVMRVKVLCEAEILKEYPIERFFVPAD